MNELTPPQIIFDWAEFTGAKNRGAHMVEHDDLKWIVELTERKSIDAKYSPKFLRLKKLVDNTA